MSYPNSELRLILVVLSLIFVAMSTFEGILAIIALGVAVASIIIPTNFPLWPLKTIWMLCDVAVMVILCCWYVPKKHLEQLLSVIEPTFSQWSTAVVNQRDGRFFIAIPSGSARSGYLSVWELPHFTKAEDYLKRKRKAIYDKWIEAESSVDEYNKLSGGDQQDQQDRTLLVKYSHGAAERLFYFRMDLKELSNEIAFGKENKVMSWLRRLASAANRFLNNLKLYTHKGTRIGDGRITLCSTY